jgi:uncharacterized protein (DUF433 family)
MVPPIPGDVVPLRDDGRGGLRVGASRVSLEVLLDEFERGSDPESVVSAYPTLDLADVYAVIAYYLRHKEEVGKYLERRRGEAAALRREIEARQPGTVGLREKLLARRAQKEQGHAPARG